jgi:hypothetical protein
MILSGIVEKISKPVNLPRSVTRVILFALLFLHFSLNAQEFGGNPPSMKWRQIDTRHARVIFPEGLDSFARDVSALVRKLAGTTTLSLGTGVRKIDIVLQNQPTFSNGYVALGPFRSEFYLTPRQNSFELGSLPWHKKLALHEYRHVQQYSNFRHGLSRFAYYIFGEEGQALANSVAIPDWFFEGDAVYQETTLSLQGRGRMPFFFNGYRSLWTSGKNYSWMKLRNGSFKDFVPDHYLLGYMLVNYGYRQYGGDVWKKITSDAAAFKGLFYPFQKAFKRNTGHSFNNFTADAFKYFGRNAAGTEPADSASVFASRQKRFVSDQHYPQWISDDELVFLESSFSRIPVFYRMDLRSRKVTKIRTKGVSASTYFSANDSTIVYTSFVPHPRWGWKNYESVTIVDINSGREKRLTHGKRYLSPSISKDGSLIVAVNVETSGNNSLHLLNARDGSLVKEIIVKEPYVLTYPVFLSSDSLVCAIRNTEGEMALARISSVSGDLQLLTPFSMEVIAFPRVDSDTIFFSRSDGNQDKNFALVNGTVTQFSPSISNLSTGSYHLAARNGRYAWTTFTSAGLRMFTGGGKFHADHTNNSNPFPLHVPDTKFNFVQTPADTSTPATKYNQTFRLFNFHSWRPYFSDPDYTYSIISNNILNTFQTELYVNYNRNERFKETGAQMLFGGLYPVLHAGASYTFDRSFTDTARTTTWNEFNGRVGAYVPWQFSTGAFNQSLNIGSSFNTKQVYYTGASKELYETKKFNYAELSISAANQQLRARQNIFPRIAQTMFARYRRIINNYSANQLLLNSSIYLPGLMRNHNLVMQFAFQRRDTLQQYVFPNNFPVSRGYPDIDFPRMWKAGFNYHMPLVYPDLGFANIVYLLRVRSNLYYDLSWVKSLRTGNTFQLDAAGVELYIDTRWWNQLPVSFGVRYCRLLDADLLGISPNQWELVLPVDLYSR